MSWYNKESKRLSCEQILTLSMLGKNYSRRHFEIFFFYFTSRKQILTFMHIVFIGVNLHGMSTVFQGKISKKKKK